MLEEFPLVVLELFDASGGHLIEYSNYARMSLGNSSLDIRGGESFVISLCGYIHHTLERVLYLLFFLFLSGQPFLYAINAIRVESQILAFFQRALQE